MALTGISGKIVLITGASGSVGSGVAVNLAKIGAKLALTGRDKTKLSATAERSCLYGPLGVEMWAGLEPVFIVVGDLRNNGDVKNIVDKTVEKFGGIDILVNSAGVVKPGQFLTMNMDDYETTYTTNLRGVFVMCKMAVPHIIKRKGNIVNISSYAGIRPIYSFFSYGMFETCLDQLTRCLALELGPKGVRVNSVNPGVLKNTDFWTRNGAPYASQVDNMDKIEEGMRKMYPMNRLGEVSDVVNAVTFLISDNASFINGAILPVDGGKVLSAKLATPDSGQF
ncbi:hypothetical protein LSH36_103g05018 [Paralvinella palmiformis]|uniref:Uncharacterized protein n=1 Tax=Paralvinella palmiformis TaxID=53620 RepID=A0AAD9K130_9ANNE|nr:hypothetical protein LSH36_103g05018 [Paralvinella palmiformis]